MYRVLYTLKIYEKRRFLAVFRQNAIFCYTYRVLYNVKFISVIISNFVFQLFDIIFQYIQLFFHSNNKSQTYS